MAQIESVISFFDQAGATRAGTYIVPSYGMFWLYTSGSYELTPFEVYMEHLKLQRLMFLVLRK
jgi:hypothetical protein